MLQRMNGLLILSTDKAKYFTKFRPSVVLCVSVSFALYYETNFGRLLSSTLTLRRLMSYIYGAPILDVSRSHTTTQHSR